MDLVN